MNKRIKKSKVLTYKSIINFLKTMNNQLENVIKRFLFIIYKGDKLKELKN